MALSKIQAESMNLADTYAFSGTVSGSGANLTNLPVVGFGQTWTDFNSSGRVLSTTYTNSTGKSIFISLQTSNVTNSKVTIYIDTIKVVANWFQNGSGAQQGATAIIPSGSTYYATMTGNIALWQELR